MNSPASEEIFISHSSADAVAAQEVRDLLQSLGYATWIAPDDLVGSSSWAEQILAAVGRCHALVVLLSDAANRSDHVAREVSIAAEDGKPIVPLRLAAIEPSGSLRYLLHLSQRIDIFPPPVTEYEDRIRKALEGRGVVRRLVVRRRSRTLRLTAMAAAAAIALGAIAWFALRDDGTKADTADVLRAVPTSIADWSELDSALIDLAAAEELASGDDVQLVSARNDEGSISFAAPSTWSQVEGTIPFQDASGNVLGDLLVVSTERSSFDGGRAGGLFVGAAPMATLVPNGLDDFQPREFFLDLGCVSSELIQIAAPFGGEARLWSDCNNTPRIYVSALFGGDQVTGFVFGLVTTRQEAAAIAETLMSLEIDGTPLA
ncbi:MAG: toll/interleukin-1 receptor domain-containing protein [Actinomycetia bacterium]|nr:toll/interleukin-1 receptor domain-containing protein [Actinomycetes bacterium]